jgi:hypothetical protein
MYEYLPEAMPSKRGKGSGSNPDCRIEEAVTAALDFKAGDLKFIECAVVRPHSAGNQLSVVTVIDRMCCVQGAIAVIAIRHFRIDRIETCVSSGQHFGEFSERLVKQWEQEKEIP